MRILLTASLLLALLPASSAMSAAPQAPMDASPGPDAAGAEDALDLRCLRDAYPAIRALETDSHGRQWLVFADARRVLYRDAAQQQMASPPVHSGDGDVASSMAAPYPLEPERPPTPPGFAPGRLRSPDLLAALYGSEQKAVGSGLQTVLWQGRPVRLSAPAARALARVAERLEPVLALQAALRPYLTSEGGFAWRRIAGENRLSPHAFGIAIDINAKRAPYWRWSRARPHPLQQSYPPEIVAAFEAEGFIWGGKWHEYDLMHFEYRPELICKARLRRKMAQDAAPHVERRLHEEEE
ncbi:M15 family metallopeptidase [uncultured Desulfovibrio sp.]|uniref:M15 family metallopeptidase n=1 Tax=uncultured Desulfovibrio sp. TaxID=167968 RepID=UPI002803824A|nr:M15 family metallopeptidase [uncultured Desulfovibrio sp.]